MTHHGYLHRGMTVRELISKLSEHDPDMYVVLTGFDHSFEWRIDISIQEAEYDSGHLSCGYADNPDNFNVVVIS